MQLRSFGCLVSVLASCFGQAGAQDDATLSLVAEGSVELKASWEPFTDSVYGFGEKFALVRNLKPAQESASYETAAFRPFLPEGAVKLGETWSFDPKEALPFLRQLHPGATDRLHHGWFGQKEVPGVAAPGAWACLRALGPRWAEIVVRVHADFLLDGDGTRGSSSWMTPAQFQGRLVIDREKSAVAHFELALPDQSANVDLNIAQDGGIIADIGRIPRLELRSESREPATFQYAEEIRLAVARRAIEREVYPYAAIDWLSLAEALARSKSSGKPLHVIALFGSLMDESC